MVNPVMVYVSHSPCLNCARELVKAGVKYVHQSEPTELPWIQYLESNGVTVRSVSECPY